MTTEQNTAPASETPNGTAPIQGETPITPGSGETPGTTTEPSPAEIRKEIERLNASLKRANAEAKENRLAKEELDKLKATQMTEQERKDKAYTDLQAQHDEHVRTTLERTIKYEIKLQAAELGINPKRLDYVARMLEWEEIETNDQGEPTNIKDLLDTLVKDMPELLGKPAKAAPTAGGPTAPERSQSSGNGEITAEYVADVLSGKIPWQSLTPERRNAIHNWQAQHSYRF